MPKIDREMAEKVMRLFQKLDDFTNVVYWCDGSVYPTQFIMPVNDWHPSTDIGQALGDGKSFDTVVGKMRERGFCFKLECRASGEFIAVFYKNHIRFVGEYYTPAMAICKAALACVEE